MTQYQLRDEEKSWLHSLSDLYVHSPLTRTLLAEIQSKIMDKFGIAEEHVAVTKEGTPDGWKVNIVIRLPPAVDEVHVKVVPSEHR